GVAISDLRVDANGQAVAMHLEGMAPGTVLHNLILEQFATSGLLLNRAGVGLECEGMLVNNVIAAAMGASRAFHFSYVQQSLFNGLIVRLATDEASAITRGLDLVTAVHRNTFTKVDVEDAVVPVDI